TMKYSLLETCVNSLAVPVGYMLVLVLFACMRERLEGSDSPRSWKGVPIALVTAALMAMAFAGLAGII
ncbi:MAG: electron transport complex subunit RsxA, partial [Erysipelotrichaceae bacterium]|nr:electron transport complex subunit RsxA [Erysipelotrichaceae bacterium]